MKSINQTEIYKEIITDQRRWQLSSDNLGYDLTPSSLEPYRCACKTQLDQWLLGILTHNRFAGECLPDFSCCGMPVWATERRKEFAEADELTRFRMLMGSLGTRVTKPAPAKALHLVDQRSQLN